MFETPEGYLVCRAVPIARLGEMSYTAAETGDGQPLIAVNTPAVLFGADTVASFEGKPVTVYHPQPNADPTMPDVTPQNWRAVAVGIAQSVRPGTGEDADKLVADLMITDQVAIELVKNGLREISCGYEAFHGEKDAEGRAIRNQIIGNHIALVDRGRAGSDVAIRDSKPEGKTMAGEIKKWLDKLRKVADEMPIEEEPVVDADPVDPMAAFEARLSAMEEVLAQALMDMKPADEIKVEIEEDPKTEPEPEPMMDKCKDEAVLSLAEIIAPGIENTVDVKKQALIAGMRLSDARDAIVAIAGESPDFENQAAVDVLFSAVATVLTDRRKAALVKTKTADNAPSVNPAVVTPQQINEMNARAWAKREVNV